jgi:TRAP-type C4-dicarboxylate transport system permease small subunit
MVDAAHASTISSQPGRKESGPMTEPSPAENIAPKEPLPTTVRITELLGGLAVGLIFLLVVAEILFRLVGLTFGLSYDYCGFLMGICMFITLPAVTYHNEHISVGAEPVIAFFGKSLDVLMLLYVLVLTFATALITYRSFHEGSRSQGLTMTPLVYPQAVIFVALCVTTVVLTMRLVRSRQRAADPTAKEEGANG